VRGFLRAHRRSLLTVLALGGVAAFGFGVLPQIAGFGTTLQRLRYANEPWLLAGVLLEGASLAGYMAIFRSVFSCDGVHIGWRESYEITMAGAVATKLLSAAGAGGVAVTVWALHSLGLKADVVARRMTTFDVLLYGVYMGALVIFGIGLASGLFPGPAPLTLTALPAALAAVLIGLVLALNAIPDDVQSRLAHFARGSQRLRRALTRLATVPRTLHDGIATALEMLHRPRPGLLGALAYWGFDIATLGAAFHAVGQAPRVAVVVLGYFVGMSANLLPLPGGVGGVESGMIGAFIAFGMNGNATVLAVLSYRAISFWLPMIPGLAAYLQLRRTLDRSKATDDEPRDVSGSGRRGSSSPPRSSPAE
jgi:putative heme transporter